MPLTTSGSFFALCLTATFGYALQSTLMAKYYREIDRLSAVAYRGLSLGISMLPLLFFVPASEFARVAAILPAVLGASVAAALANWCSAKAYSYLPVGIAAAASMGFATVCTALLGVMFFGERLSLEQTLVLLALILTVLALGKTRSAGSLPKEYNVSLGICSSFFFGIGISLAYSFVGFASRQSHPFLVGYLWESVIGLVALAIAFLRAPRSTRALCPLPSRELFALGLASSPTVLGTACYAYAVTIGPIGIATTVLGTMMVFTAILSRFLYQEKLSAVAWSLLFAVCVLLALLKVTLG